MRTVDVARRAGCSVQQVRKLEKAGVLPPAPRNPSGYRNYGDVHIASLLAYRKLSLGVGPVEARLLLCDAHDDPAKLLARVDAAHARLHQERHELGLARLAVQSIGVEPMADIQEDDAMSVGELAVALGIRPSTLRHWEAERLLTPARTQHRARRYSPTDVRNARLVHQLRAAGYRIAPLRDLLPTLQHSHDWSELLAAREHSIHERAKALFQGMAVLASVVDLNATTPRSRPGSTGRS